MAVCDNLFRCQQDKCLNSCCGAYSGFTDILCSVEHRPFKDIVLTSDDYESMYNAGLYQYIYIAEDGLGRMKISDDGVCSAFSNGKCLVNDLKPTVCKCYPLCIDVLTGLCSFRACPSVEDSFDINSYREQLDALICMYEFWISRYKEALTQ